MADTPMHFTKMHGAGNDYIYLDCFAQSTPDNPGELARRMTDRHYGIGGDGLILICPTTRADAEMRMYNVDGTSAEMCGNAIRCVAKYVYEHGLARRDRLEIVSAGTCYLNELTLKNGKVDRVRVDMNEPILDPARIPTTFTGDAVVAVPVEVAGREVQITSLSMGNPHCVVFTDSITDDWVRTLGPAIENHPCFPQRTNVEFATIESRCSVRQRTWERGCGETLACGSGASAVCVAGVLTGQTDRRITVHLLGGDLEIEWDEQTHHVHMTGPAVEVFSGEWPNHR